MTIFRKLAASGDTAGDKAKKAKTNKPAATKSNGKKGGKQTAARTPSPDGDDEENPLTPPATATRPKRSSVKRDYAAMNGEDSVGEGSGDEDDGLDKKVKIEVGEDIGEGLRQAADLDGEADGADMAV